MRHQFLLFAFLGLLVAACGSEAPTAVDVTKGARPAKAVVMDIGKLVPQDALAIVYSPSLDDLVAKIKGVVASVDPQMAAQVDTKEMMEEMPLGKFWDGSKPFALAVKLSEGGDPLPTLIHPVTNVAEAKQIQGGPTRVFAGNYVSMVMGPGAPAEPGSETHRLLKEPVANDLTLRIDVAGIMKHFGPQIDEMTKEMAQGGARMGPAGDMFGGVLDKVMSFAKAADIADVGISMTGSEVDLRFALSMTAGSEFDKPSAGTSRAMDYAKMLPPSMPVQGVMHMEQSLIAEMMDWMLKAFSEAGADNPDMKEFADSMAAMKDLYKLMGPNYAFGVGMGDAMKLVMVADSSDPETYFAKWEALMQKGTMEKMGMKYEKLAGTKTGNIDVHSYKITMDMEKLMAASGGQAPQEAMQQMDGMMKMFFGGDGMTAHMAAVDKKIVLTMGGVDQMKEAIQFAQSGGGTLCPGLKKAIDYTGGTPTFAVDIDIRELLQQIQPLLAEQGAEMPAVPKGKPAHVLLYGGRDGRTYRGGVSISVGEIMEVVKAMKGK